MPFSVGVKGDSGGCFAGGRHKDHLNVVLGRVKRISGSFDVEGCRHRPEPTGLGQGAPGLRHQEEGYDHRGGHDGFQTSKQIVN